MKWSFFPVALTVSALALGLAPRPARGDEVPKEFKETIKKGLAWLVKNQKKAGYWAANGEQYPIPMTGMAGMALLMEGSTIREGKYADNIKRAADWLMQKTRINADGLIANRSNPAEINSYMYGHGFATLFLASVYGDEDDKDRRARLKAILTKAVKFIGDAQSTQGGWYYTSAKDGHDADEGSVTITQLQALRACRNAGIPVPKQIIKKARTYLEKATTANGGVVYSLGRGGMAAPIGGERPALTAAAVSCGFSAGEYNSKTVKKWIQYCKGAMRTGGGRMGHDEYTNYYWAQAVYVMGDKGYAKLFPKSRPNDRVTWTKYRASMFKQLKNTQNKNGSWAGGWGIGTVYATSLYLTILQLDNATLPIYQR
jgi:hypothetical protein